MHDLFDRMLEAMDAAFRDYEARVPGPKRIQNGPIWVFRFTEENIYQALIQKLVVVQSGLRAAQILLRYGHVMEQGMLQRNIDEANEDILFLVYGLTSGMITPLHEQYLTAFWAEEFTDYSNLIASHQSRPMTPRKKIRAYNASFAEKGPHSAKAAQAGKVVSKVFSGFVHGASPQIMECFSGNPPQFQTRGMTGTPRIPEYTRSLWNYMYRGLLSHMFVGQAFGAEQRVQTLTEDKKRFESLMGVNYEVPPSADRDDSPA